MLLKAIEMVKHDWLKYSFQSIRLIGYCFLTLPETPSFLVTFSGFP